MLAEMLGEVLCWHARIIRLRWSDASARSRLASAPPSPRIRFAVTAGPAGAPRSSAPVSVAARPAMVSPAPMLPEFTRDALHLALGVRQHGADRRPTPRPRPATTAARAAPAARRDRRRAPRRAGRADTTNRTGRSSAGISAGVSVRAIFSGSRRRATPRRWPSRSSTS